jgi:hypothetical protein
MKSSHAAIRGSNFRIVLEHYWDNTVTEEQTAAIDEFLADFADHPVAQRTTLRLPGDIEVKVQSIEGTSGVCMVRPMGGDRPAGPFIHAQKFIDKATEKIQRGIGQLSSYPASTRILALNIQTPDASLRSEDLVKLQNIVERESSGSVQCVIFLHGHFLEA